MSTHQTLKSYDKDFKQSIGISVIAHLIILFFFILKVSFFDKPMIDISQAIRVDMVGLPDKLDSNKLPAKVTETLTEKPKLPEKVDLKQEVTTEKPVEKKIVIKEKKQVKDVKTDSSAIDLKKTQSKQKQAFEKLKKLSAIEKIKQEVRNENIEKAVKEATKAVALKGQVISAGSTLTGLDKIEANNFLLQVDQQVKQHWALPQWLMNKSFKTKILVKFDINGRIISRTVMTSSGEPSYDNYCLQAVDQAAPFPRVPEKFSEKFSVDGVVIGFPE